jgi:tetratricopeptide (TPR) repeat protein
VYLDAQAWNKAWEVAGLLRGRHPRGVVAEALEGDLLMGQREYARAAKAFERAAGIEDSGELRVQWHKASSAAAGAFGPDAELLEWLRRHPEDSRTRRYLAAAYLDAGRSRDAAEQYRLLVKADPRDARALNNLAWTLHQLGDPEALDLAQRARLLDPESAAIADTLGWLLLQRGRDNEALPLLTEAVAIDSATPAIRYHRAEALRRVGDLGAARTELKRIIDTAAGSEYATKASDLLRRIGS